MQYKTNLRSVHVYLGSHLHFISFEFLCYLSLILGRRRVFLFRSRNKYARVHTAIGSFENECASFSTYIYE